MKSFTDDLLDSKILKAIKDLNFDVPTSIQTKAIPHIISTDKDLIATAQTGTGKTAAFGLPSIQLTNNKDKTTSQPIKKNVEQNDLKLKNDQISIKIMDFNKVKRREKINSSQRVKKIKVVYFD